MNYEPSANSIEILAQALWDAKEDRNYDQSQRRPWQIKDQPADYEYDCNRFEYNRNDHRNLARETLKKMHDEHNTGILILDK